MLIVLGDVFEGNVSFYYDILGELRKQREHDRARRERIALVRTGHHLQHQRPSDGPADTNAQVDGEPSPARGEFRPGWSKTDFDLLP